MKYKIAIVILGIIGLSISKNNLYLIFAHGVVDFQFLSNIKRIATPDIQSGLLNFESDKPAITSIELEDKRAFTLLKDIRSLVHENQHLVKSFIADEIYRIEIGDSIIISTPEYKGDRLTIVVKRLRENLLSIQFHTYWT